MNRWVQPDSPGMRQSILRSIVVHRLNPLLGNIVAGRVKVNLSHNLTNQGDSGECTSQEIFAGWGLWAFRGFVLEAYPLAQVWFGLLSFLTALPRASAASASASADP